ncbi:MAG TPA: glycosyltransferase family 1 protein, partial [bacterium]|nr:glycosyltransferase family 1 protein [bacterium]
MNVVLDARTVGRRFSGVGFYVLELIRAFSRIEADHTFHLLIHGESAIEDLVLDRRFRIHRPWASPESHPWGDLWEELVLPRLALSLQADVLHGPAFLIPLRRTKIATVVTIPDLVAFTHPRTIPGKYALYMRGRIRRAVQTARRTICISESAKQDVLRVLAPPERRIACIHLGVSERFHPATPERIGQVRRHYGLERPYILFVGNLEPRKNLGGLVRAFRIMRQDEKEPLDLVVAGQIAWKSEGLLRVLGADDVRDSIRLTGYFPSEDLPALYSGARAFVFPTLWEGFGMPV